jgi:hypothetical protein
MSRKVLLHVGTPKTGTSYFQDVLFRNREVLAAAGIAYPASRHDSHFLAALDLMQLPWGGLQSDAIGAWADLAREVREAFSSGASTAIISHEILATASRAQIGQALESLGHGAGGGGAEVHLVLSVRDLVRQIPAEWQENVKHRAQLSYGGFLDQIRDPERATRIGAWFWGVQEIPEILDRWGQELPPEQVHLVTVPPPGGAPELLWKRFSQAFGLDGIDLDLEGERHNPSLGVPETTLLRRINRKANAELAPGDYRPLVRELLAHQTLSRRTSSPRLALPPELHPWVQELSASWIAEIEARRYDVIGDLGDLVGAPPVSEYADPDRPRERQVAAAGVDAITALLLDNARLRRDDERLHAELADVRGALERAQATPSYRVRRRIVLRLENSGFGRALLGVYRRARGRSSRSA